MARKNSGEKAKAAKNGKSKLVIKQKDKLLPKFTALFFDRPRLTAILWLAVALFGAVSYTTLLKREGFPSVQIPVAIISGSYLANDPAKVDANAAKPLADIAMQQEGAATVQTQSADNFFTAAIQYEEGTDAKEAVKRLEQTVKDSGKLPKDVQLQYNVPYFGATGGEARQIDVAAAFYKVDGKTDTAELAKKAEEAAAWLRDRHIADVKDVFVKSPFESVTNPANGQKVTVQRTFDRYGLREDSDNKFYDSVTIGFSANTETDVIKLHEHVQAALDEMNDQPQFAGYRTNISASFAPSIEETIGELQRVLLEGLLAVLVVGSIVIAIRASLITVISMVTVVAATIGLLYAIGYTLNVITLFSLILGLALIVDDTIIMVEAIDAARSKEKDPKNAVKTATRKVSRAMVAATLTACLSFAPLAFVGGILGEFIRAIPVTIISSLLISLLVALVFIPFLSRFLLLRPKHMGKGLGDEVAAKFEAKLAHFITRPMRWARGSSLKLYSIGIIAALIGIGFVIGGGLFATRVTFNIFPPTKDTNGVILNMNFPDGTDVTKARDTAQKAEELAQEVIGEEFVQAAYFSMGTAQSATVQVQLTPYGEREVRAPELVDRLQERFNRDFKEAQVVAAQLDVGPPASAFVAQFTAENREAALKAAGDLKAFLQSSELERLDGSKARMVNVTQSSSDAFIREGTRPVVQVSAGFDADDTSTLVNLAQDAIKDEFNAEKMRSYGLNDGDLTFSLGQEAENQESFNSLVLAFPILLAAMFVLLAVQFRSLLQPLLIFLAIPFSLFGVMVGLFLTDNAISFFTMLGFFALIGLSIKNTILLTDFANQARRAGAGPIDAAVAALEERFRPLFATSMTAVVSLIPLTITSPFWEGLGVVLIFGLLSSTFLVITVFPYYYLGAEYLRIKFRRGLVVFWIVAMIAGAAALASLDKSEFIPFWILICAIYPVLYVLGKRKVLKKAV